jgi:hypothetical protein
MYKLTLVLLRILVASLFAGVALSYFNITPEQIFSDIGVNSQSIKDVLRRLLVWAMPHIALGAVVILPVWLIIYLFKPSRD